MRDDTKGIKAASRAVMAAISPNLVPDEFHAGNRFKNAHGLGIL